MPASGNGRTQSGEQPFPPREHLASVRRVCRGCWLPLPSRHAVLLLDSYDQAFKTACGRATCPKHPPLPPKRCRLRAALPAWPGSPPHPPRLRAHAADEDGLSRQPRFAAVSRRPRLPCHDFLVSHELPTAAGPLRRRHGLAAMPRARSMIAVRRPLARW